MPICKGAVTPRGKKTPGWEGKIDRLREGHLAGEKNLGRNHSEGNNNHATSPRRLEYLIKGLSEGGKGKGEIDFVSQLKAA